MSENAGPQALRQLLDAVMSVSADLDLSSVLHRIVVAAVGLVDARYGALGVLDESKTSLAEFITVGLDTETYGHIGELPKGHGILGLLIVDPKPLRLPDLREHPDSYGFPPHHPPMQSFLGVPVLVRQAVFGNLYLTDKQGAEVFSDIDEELTMALAGAAGVAIENARLHARVQELAILEDRERIARHLHDTVIQRLFASGLSLQGTARLAQRPEVAGRIEEVVEDLDDTVKHIRTVIFGLERSRFRDSGLRNDVLTLVQEAAGALGFTPKVVFEGLVDTVIDQRLAGELLSTLREALSNTARHAAATAVDVLVGAGADIVLRVCDNGRGGPGPIDGPAHGLRNMRARAESLGGSFTMGPAEGGGTVVQWRVPISPGTMTGDP